MFLIYNTVTFSVVQRRPMIGTLRALGVTRRQIFAMILSEAALLSAVGAIFGIGAGIIMGRLAVIVVTQTISNLYFTVTVRSVSIPLVLLLKGQQLVSVRRCWRRSCQPMKPRRPHQAGHSNAVILKTKRAVLFR